MINTNTSQELRNTVDLFEAYYGSAYALKVRAAADELDAARASIAELEASLKRALAQRDFCLFDATPHVSADELANFSAEYDAAIEAAMKKGGE